jgi:hypothetical protein
VLIFWSVWISILLLRAPMRGQTMPSTAPTVAATQAVVAAMPSVAGRATGVDRPAQSTETTIAQPTAGAAPTRTAESPESRWPDRIIAFVMGVILGFLSHYLFPTIRETQARRRDALLSVYLNLAALRPLYIHQAGNLKAGVTNPVRASQIAALENTVRHELAKIPKLAQRERILGMMSAVQWANDPYGRREEIGDILDQLGKMV